MNKLVIASIPADELKQLIADVIDEKFAAMILPTAALPQPMDFLTRNEVSQILRVSTNTVDKFTRLGILPGYKINSRIRYKRAEVEQALSQVETNLYRRLD